MRGKHVLDKLSDNQTQLIVLTGGPGHGDVRLPRPSLRSEWGEEEEAALRTHDPQVHGPPRTRGGSRQFRRLETFHRIFSRSDKLDVIFAAIISFALIVQAPCFTWREQVLG